MRSVRSTKVPAMPSAATVAHARARLPIAWKKRPHTAQTVRLKLVLKMCQIAVLSSANGALCKHHKAEPHGPVDANWPIGVHCGQHKPMLCKERPHKAQTVRLKLVLKKCQTAVLSSANGALHEH